MEDKIKVEVYCRICNAYRNVNLNRQVSFPDSPETGDDRGEEFMTCPKCGYTSKITLVCGE